SKSRASKRKTPPVDMEYRERVQIAVVFAQPEPPANGDRVEPMASMGQDNSLGSRRRARRVVDSRRSVLGDGRPFRLGVGGLEPSAVSLAIEDDPGGRGDVGELLVELWVDEQSARFRI